MAVFGYFLLAAVSFASSNVLLFPTVHLSFLPKHSSLLCQRKGELKTIHLCKEFAGVNLVLAILYAITAESTGLHF